MFLGKKWFLIFAIYFLVGIFLIKDYGVSTDEPTERTTMYVNLNYILTRLDQDREPMEVPELHSYKDKYYGIFLQMPTAVFEIGHKDLRYIFWGRHLYTFSICILGYIAFFFLCRRLFQSDFMGILGTAMIALYPRFFAEQFYNIKDMFFVSVFMVSMWATVKLIEHNFSWKWVILFSLIVAVATNVRIVGIVFLLLIIGYIWIAFLLEKMYGITYHHLTLKKCTFLTIGFSGIYLICLAILMPSAWENPIYNIAEMFKLFSQFKPRGNVIFMGQNLRSDKLPWYYVPVWMLISIPVWYIIAAVWTCGICFIKGLSFIKNKDNSLYTFFFKYKYMIWCLLLMLVPWLGIVIKHSSLYNGWRHCYFMMPPFILAVLYGINYLRKKEKYITVIISLLILIGMGSQIRWIAINHPNEMVYFNSVGKNWASQFDRDYWHMDELQAYKYIAENDKSEKITVNTSGYKFFTYLLSDEERSRVEISDNPTYYIETYRGRVGNEFEMEGYEEFYSIVVDGFKVTTVMKKVN